MKLFAKIPTPILTAPGSIEGFLVASDRASVAYQYGPHGYDEGVPTPALSLVDVVTAMRTLCGRAELASAMEGLGLDATPPLSPVQCLRDPELRDVLARKGFDGFAGRTHDGKGVLEVAWLPGTFGIVRAERASAGRATMDGDGLGITLTTSGRQLALDLLHEGLEVGRTARANGAPEDVEVRANHHVLTWLLDRCEGPEGMRFGFDEGAMIAHVGGVRHVCVVLGLDVLAAVDEGRIELPPLDLRPAPGMG